MGQSLKCGKLKCLTSFCGRAGTVFEIDQSLQCGIKWLILFCGRAGSLFFGNRSDALMRQRKIDWFYCEVEHEDFFFRMQIRRYNAVEKDRFYSVLELKKKSGWKKEKNDTDVTNRLKKKKQEKILSEWKLVTIIRRTQYRELSLKWVCIIRWTQYWELSLNSECIISWTQFVLKSVWIAVYKIQIASSLEN